MLDPADLGFHMEEPTQNSGGEKEPQKGFLNTFWQLSEPNDETRINAASSLLFLLANKQGKDSLPCQELTYTLKRLVRGLSSSRKCARLGFAMALSQTLKTFPVVTISGLIELIRIELKIEGNDSRGEQREVIFGRALAYMAIIQSGRLNQLQGSELGLVVKGLLDAQKSRTPLHIMCCEGLVKIMESVSSSDFEEHVWPLIQETLGCGWEEATPDVLWVLLSAREHQKAVVDKAFMSDYWGCTNIVSEKNFDKIGNVFMFCSSDHPVIHPLCPKLLSLVSKKGNLSLFWNSVVNGKLLPADKVNRKFLALELVPIGLAMASSVEEVEAIMSPDLVKELIKNLTHKGNLLCKACKHLVDQLIQFVGGCKSGPIQLAVLKSLITSPGSVLFDSITRTRATGAIISAFNRDAARNLLLILEDILRGDDPLVAQPVDPSSQEFETKQKWAATTLSRISVLATDEEDAAFQANVLQFLLLVSFFNLDKVDKEGAIPHCVKPIKVPINMSLRHVLQETFFSTLNKLSTYRSKTMTNAKDRRPFIRAVHNILTYAKLLLSKTDNVSLVKAWEPQVEESWRKATTVLEKIHAKHEGDEKMNEGHAFQLLFSHCSLQLFRSPDSALDALSELHACYDKAMAKKRRRSVAPKSDSEPEWVDVITDLLLSLLSQNSHLVRVVVNDVFTILCPFATQNTVGLILDVIKSGEDDEEGALAFEDDDEEEQDEQDGESDSEDEEKKEDESSDSDSSGDDEEVLPEVDEKFRSDVKAALGNAAVESDEEEELSDLDDETMFKFDDALAAVLKKRNTKQTEKEKEKQLKIYKNKCLDLLDKLVRNNRSPSILLELLIPLLELIEIGHKEKTMRELGAKAKKLLAVVCKQGKLPPDPSVDREELPVLVESLVEFSKKVSGLPVMLPDIANAVMLVVRILLGRDSDAGPSPVRTRSQRAALDQKRAKPPPSDDYLAKIQGVLKTAVTDFCSKRDSNINHLFLKQILEKQATVMWPIADLLLKSTVDPEIRIFCRSQTSTMLAGMITTSTVNNLSEEEWSPFAERCVQQLVSVVESLVASDQHKPRYTGGVLTVLINIMKVSKDKQFEGVDFEALESNVLKLKSMSKGHQKSKDLRQTFDKTINCIQSRKSGDEGKRKNKRKRKAKDKEPEEETQAEEPKQVKDDDNESMAAAETTKVTDVAEETPQSKKKRKKKRKSEAGVSSTPISNSNVEDGDKEAGSVKTTFIKDNATNGNGIAVNGILSESDSEAGNIELKTPAKNLKQDFESASSGRKKSSKKGKLSTPSASAAPVVDEGSAKKTSPSPGKRRRKSLRSAAKILI